MKLVRNSYRRAIILFLVLSSHLNAVEEYNEFAQCIAQYFQHSPCTAYFHKKTNTFIHKKNGAKLQLVPRIRFFVPNHRDYYVLGSFTSPDNNTTFVISYKEEKESNNKVVHIFYIYSYSHKTNEFSYITPFVRSYHAHECPTYPVIEFNLLGTEAYIFIPSGLLGGKVVGETFYYNLNNPLNLVPITRNERQIICEMDYFFL